nr:MAG TPA: hypothetical protein [Caudoviricetes sp.]
MRSLIINISIIISNSIYYFVSIKFSFTKP